LSWRHTASFAVGANEQIAARLPAVGEAGQNAVLVLIETDKLGPLVVMVGWHCPTHHRVKRGPGRARTSDERDRGFADSPLEEERFEPLVPGTRKRRTEGAILCCVFANADRMSFGEGAAAEVLQLSSAGIRHDGPPEPPCGKPDDRRFSSPAEVTWEEEIGAHGGVISPADGAGS
jgi:hypothetical protein